MKKDTTKATMLVISMGFLVVHLVFGWQWAITVSLVVGLIGIFSNFLSRKIEWAWMKLSEILSKIVPSILLALVFYLFLFPISLLSKLFRKDPLMLKNNHDSYFIDIDKEFSKTDLEKPW